MTEGSGCHGSDGAVAVVHLDRWRAASRAAEFLRGCLHDPPWLKEVTVQVVDGGDVRVLVVLRWETPLIKACLPTAVDRIPVHLAVTESR